MAVVRSRWIARAKRAGASRVSLKCENLQKTGSFKVRGVLNKLSRMTEAERARGVIGFSAGNHAQALAWGAHGAGKRCTVVMPATAPRIKVDAVREYGAEVDLVDLKKKGRLERLGELAKQFHEAYVASHYDDP